MKGDDGAHGAEAEAGGHAHELLGREVYPAKGLEQRVQFFWECEAVDGLPREPFTHMLSWVGCEPGPRQSGTVPTGRYIRRDRGIQDLHVAVSCVETTRTRVI